MLSSVLRRIDQPVEQVPGVADLDRADCRRLVEQHARAEAMTAGFVAVYDKLTQ